MRTVLLSDLLTLADPADPVAIIFTPDDRRRMVEALDRATGPSLALEQLRQHLSGEAMRYSLPACRHESARLLAAKGA